jgi:RNA polymerase-binding protein DksA
VTSGVAALRSIVQEVLMPKREVDAYRAQLETQLAALVGQGAATVHHMVENGDGIPDPNDRATREEDRNWSLRLRDRDRRLIGKIEEALADRVRHVRHLRELRPGHLRGAAPCTPRDDPLHPLQDGRGAAGARVSLAVTLPSAARRATAGMIRPA